MKKRQETNEFQRAQVPASLEGVALLYWVGDQCGEPLTGCIPKCKLNVLSIDFDIGDIVLEDSGDVDLNKDKIKKKTRRESVSVFDVPKHEKGGNNKTDKGS